MSHIRILPADVANRIAAGEVVERPASVVKELVENAIDAGASRISVKVSKGGRNLIHVVDDGCGMDRDDALLCLEAHATSKIRDSRDIEHISTLGFRGEAVPSIASVSRFQLQTRQPEAVAGTEVFVEGGQLRDVRECGCPTGTSIKVQQLFHNLPVRRKFLRTPATEDAHIEEIVLLHALANPGVAFELTADGRNILQVSSTADLGTRIGMLLGREVYDAMLPVEYQEGGLSITGYAGRPGLTRSTRREQRVFINGRPASADIVFMGIREAYQTMIMRGRYAPVVLYLQMPVDQVDVNVHPSKREVRFREPRQVGQIVAAAIRRALQQLATPQFGGARPLPPPIPARSPDLDQLFNAPIQPRFHMPSPDGTSRSQAPATQPGIKPEPTPPPQLGESVPPPALPTTGPVMRNPQTSPVENAVPPPDAAGDSSRDDIRNLNVLGNISSRYIVAGGDNGLVLIDQRAAHERILFERLLETAQKEERQSQTLLMPVTVELAPADATLMHKTMVHFNHLGFQLESFGGNTFLVAGIPAHFPQNDISGLIRDVLDELRQSPGGVVRQDEIRIAQAACKHAVKGEDNLAPAEIRQLLDDLARAQMPYTCPQGRPVMVHMPFAELERRFGRR